MDEKHIRHYEQQLARLEKVHDAIGRALRSAADDNDDKSFEDLEDDGWTTPINLGDLRFVHRLIESYAKPALEGEFEGFKKVRGITSRPSRVTQ